jgi:hypothetical protein
MDAVGANTGGQIGSVRVAAIMLSVLKGMGIGWEKFAEKQQKRVDRTLSEW